jgi:oxygen-independent coproporphyrinogen-3 oxidase
MNDRELSLMGRVHSSARSKEILFDPTLSGFTSIGVDVMYGLPGQTIESLSRTLEPVFASPYVRHISAYELTIAHDTPFGRHRSLLPLPGQERMETLTETLWQTLEARGYKQYEVSNFALEGHCCRHNEVYWDHGQYLGLGCAAHSFIGKSRWANVKDLSHYIFTMNNGSFALEFKEQLDYEKLAMEMVFLGLRRVRGIDEEAFKTRCGADIFDYVNRDKLYAFMEEGLLTYNKPFWAPTKKGLLLADAMARELA